MINQFDSTNYPDIEPTKVVAGERWAWKRSEITSAYPTSLYTLEYRMCLQQSSHSDITFQASKVASEHVVELSSATTANYVEGEYWWQAVVIRDADSEEVVVNRGYMTIDYDLGQHAGDTRSWARKTLDAIRAVLYNTASKEDEEYQIAGRSLKRRSIDDLLTMEKEFARRVAKEEEELAIENGRSTGRNRVYIKMGA